MIGCRSVVYSRNDLKAGAGQLARLRRAAKFKLSATPPLSPQDAPGRPSTAAAAIVPRARGRPGGGPARPSRRDDRGDDLSPRPKPLRRYEGLIQGHETEALDPALYGQAQGDTACRRSRRK